jgi:hypothetical protein
VALRAFDDVVQRIDALEAELGAEALFLGALLNGIGKEHFRPGEIDAGPGKGAWRLVTHAR